MLRIFTDPRCLRHQPPPGFPERRERLEAIQAHLRQGPWEMIEETTAEDVDEAIATVHDRAYVERLRDAVRRGDGLIDSADNPLSGGSWDAARGAVEAALAAADWVMQPAPSGGTPSGDGQRAAFVAVRPPGHHAERATAMGFCYFNNVAVAAEHLVHRYGLERVAIFDFDVHHGNGTQHLFEERADVVYLSTHQYPFYPGTGAAAETGRGAGRGATVNVPLPAGSGDDDYARAFEEQILPALRRAAPQVLLLSAGFDAWQRDPLGGMALSAASFERWGRLLGELAEEVCGGRSLSLLEGGYDLAMLPQLVERYLTGLDRDTEADSSAAGDGDDDVVDAGTGDR